MSRMHAGVLHGVGAMVAGGLLLTGALEAATWRVTTTVDDNGSCSPTDCSLREALLAAYESPGPHVVEVPPGVHQISLPPEELNSGGEHVSGLPPPRTGAFYIIDTEVAVRGLVPGEVVVDGGGLDVVFYLSHSDVELSDLTIRGGRGFYGGVVSAFGTTHILRCTIADNVARLGFGGGLRVMHSDVLVESSAIIRNWTLRGGGGISLFGSLAHHTVRIVNSTISGNTALGGGGISAFGAGRLDIVHSTITDNVATDPVSADGLQSSLATVSIVNSLFVGDGCKFPVGAGFPQSNGGNLESPLSTCFDPADGDQIGVADARLSALADNGGPTPTHAIQPASPARDTANADDCAPTDQRGLPRPQRAGCDIGAFELGGTNAPEVPALGRSGSILLCLLLAMAAVCWMAWRRASAQGAALS